MKNIKFVILMFFSLACFSCSNDLEYDFPGEDINKVYIKPNNFTVNGYDKSFAQLMKTPIGAFQNGIHLPEVASILNADEDIILKYIVDPSLVEMYNTNNKTNYKTFPEEWVAFDNNQIVISKNSTNGETNATFTINNDYISEMENGEYLLPIRLEMVSGNAILSENRNTHYFIITVYQDEDNIADIVLDNGGELLTEDRTGWKVECFNSWFGSGDPAILFDNKEDKSIFYNLSRDEVEKGMIIDMQKEYSSISGIYQACLASYYLLKSAEVYTSVDKESWDFQGKYTVSESKATVLFYQPVKARYLKLIVKETGFMGIYLNELNVLQK